MNLLGNNLILKSVWVQLELQISVVVSRKENDLLAEECSP